MTTGTATLAYAVRLPVIAKYLGQLAFVLAVITAVPLIASLMFGDYQVSGRYALITVALLLAAAASWRLREPARIQANEALTIAALTFVLSPVIMSYPVAAAGLAPLDALFEAVSAVTTTGLSTVGNPEDMPRSLLFARAWMQWYGGLGIVVLSVALLMGHQIAARRLTEPLSGETMVSTARTYARRMLTVYTLMTVLGLGLVWLLCGDAYYALVHTLSAVSTGGFSAFDNSLAGFEHWTTRYAVIGLALAGAVPLHLYYHAWRGGWREFTTDVELRALLLATAAVSALLFLLAYTRTGMAWDTAGAHAVLLGISAQTTAGFSSLDVESLDNASKLVLIAAMIVGGGVGSSAGGIKILRLLILIRLVQLLLRRTTLPTHAVLQPRLAGKPLENNDLQRALLLILLFFGVIVASWMFFVALGHPPLDSLFEVVSATGTVGLSVGVATAELHPVLKGVLCLDMLLGRLEIVALLVVLYPPTWFGKRAESA
jgi:trk system potassium uptake protein TrkH